MGRKKQIQKLEKSEIDILMDECIALVKKKKSDFFILKKMRKVMGLCYDDCIEIDPRKEFIGTALHECVHFLRKNWTENMVKYAESRLLNQTSFEKLMEFTKCLSSKLYRKEIVEKIFK